MNNNLPNIVHALDASLMYDLLNNKEFEPVGDGAMSDCFIVQKATNQIKDRLIYGSHISMQDIETINYHIK